MPAALERATCHLQAFACALLPPPIEIHGTAKGTGAACSHKFARCSLLLWGAEEGACLAQGMAEFDALRELPAPYASQAGHVPCADGRRADLWGAICSAAAARPDRRLGPADFVFVAAIAAGSFSRVDRVELRCRPGMLFAMKTVDLAGAAPTPEDNTAPGDMSATKVRRLLTEIEALRRCSHPSVCCLFDAFPGEAASTFCLVLELLPGGDLAARLRSS